MSERSENYKVRSKPGEQVVLTEDALGFLRHYVTRAKALEQYIQKLHGDDYGAFLSVMFELDEMMAKVSDMDLPQGYFWIAGTEPVRVTDCST